MNKSFFCAILLFTHSILGCSQYTNLQQFLQNYKRPFTVLILGDNGHEYLERASKDFPKGIFVLVTDKETQSSINSDNISILKFPIKYRYLNIMNKCEHFDVICYVASEFDQEVFHSIQKMADYLFLDHKVNRELLFDIKGLTSEGAGEINSESDSYMLLNTDNEGILERRSVVWPNPSLFNSSDWYHAIHSYEDNKIIMSLEKSTSKIYKILSNFKLKKLIKSQKQGQLTTEWRPGINLVTFLFFNGVYPTKPFLSELILKMGKQGKFYDSDLTPANIILTGTKLNQIDFNKKANRSKKGSVKKVLHVVDKAQPLDQLLFYIKYWDIMNNLTK